MAITKTKLNDTLSTTQKTVKSYQFVESEAATTQQVFDDVKQTAVGQEANKVVGGIKSLTSSTEVVGEVNRKPTAGVITQSAIPGAVNNALNTDISSLTAPYGRTVSVSFDADSGFATTVNDSASLPFSTGSISSILARITGLGAAPGFLQQIVTASNAKGLTNTLNDIKGSVGAFSSPSAVNQISARTQAIADDVVANATTDGRAESIAGLNSLSTEASALINDTSNAIGTRGALISDDEFLNTVTGASGVSDNNNLIQNVRDYANQRAEVVFRANEFQNDLSRIVPRNSLGFMQNLIETINPQSLDNLFRNNGLDIPRKEQQRIAILAQGTETERQQAFTIVKETSGASNAEVNRFLLDLDTTVAGTVIVDTSNSTFADPFRVGEDDARWNNGVGAKDFVFSFISSVEELEAELKNISREVTEMVVHWTETFTNSNIGSEEINEAQQKLGEKGIGYHYVIRRDGSLQRGLPSGIEGNHAEANNHNQRSIGVVFVGGLNCPSGTPNPLDFRSAQSLTRSQMTTFEEVCRAFYLAFPGGQILGHNDVDLEEDPGFNVRDYCEDIFNKKSLFTDPLNQQPFTLSEINSTRVPE